MGAPDLIQPVAAFRAWRIIDGRLWSPYIDVTWAEPVVRARCHRPAKRGGGREEHAAPAAACGCGIYAYHALIPRLARAFATPGIALGIVSVWGEIQVHADGLRAEYARVRALAFLPGRAGRKDHDRRRAAEMLEADLVAFHELADAGRDYGGALPLALRP